MAVETQKQTTHTLGPWQVREDGAIDIETAIRKDGTRALIASVWEGSTYRVPYPEAQANARLIAAAPELLRALRELVIFPSHHRENGKCVTGLCSRCEIEAVLDKAVTA